MSGARGGTGGTGSVIVNVHVIVKRGRASSQARSKEKERTSPPAPSEVDARLTCLVGKLQPGFGHGPKRKEPLLAARRSRVGGRPGKELIRPGASPSLQQIQDGLTGFRPNPHHSCIFRASILAWPWRAASVCSCALAQ